MSIEKRELEGRRVLGRGKRIEIIVVKRKKKEGRVVR
jgi:hypothetical protein